jgi:uncharacterized protein YcfL
MKNLFLGMMFLMMLVVTSCGSKDSSESTEAVVTDSTEVVTDSTAVEVSEPTEVEASAESVSE